MTRAARSLVACVLAALLAACSEPIFEDVGNDPHPPQLTVLGIGIQPPGDPPPPVAFVPPEAGLTVRPFDPTANVLVLRMAYADAGADISEVTIRDLDGPISGSGNFDEFPGIAGTLDATLDVPTSSMPGPHRIEVVAVDAQGSRSGKTLFTITVQAF